MDSFTNNNASASNNNNNNGQQKDYLDKGLDAAEKKFGGAWGQNTEKNRGINEKIVRFSLRHPPPVQYQPVDISTDRRRSQHVRKSHRQERPRKVLQLENNLRLRLRRNQDYGPGSTSAGLVRCVRYLSG